MQCEAQWKCDSQYHKYGDRCKRNAVQVVVGGGLRIKACSYHADQVEEELKNRGVKAVDVRLLGVEKCLIA